MSPAMTVDPTIIGITVTLLGIILAFCITNMTNGYNYLLQLELNKISNMDKKPKINERRKKWARAIKEFLNAEIKYVIAIILAVVIIILSFCLKWYEFFQNETIYYLAILAVALLTISFYILDLYNIMNSELEMILNENKKKVDLFKVIQFLKSLYNNDKFMVILGTIFGLCIFISFDGTKLYEFFALFTSLFFVVIGQRIINSRRIRNIDKKLNLLFTISIALFSILGVWVSMYNSLPRVYHPTINCPDYLYLIQESNTNISTGNFSISFGNYGNLPAWLYTDFHNITSSLSVIDPTKPSLVVLVPIAYENNNQHPVNFNFKIDTNFKKAGFELKYLYYGDDVLDSTAGFLKLVLLHFNLLPSLSCDYEKLNNTAYQYIK